MKKFILYATLGLFCACTSQSQDMMQGKEKTMRDQKMDQMHKQMQDQKMDRMQQQMPAKKMEPTQKPMQQQMPAQKKDSMRKCDGRSCPTNPHCKGSCSH